VTPKVKVDTGQIEDAADVFGSQVAPDIFNAASTLAFAMTGGMAGNDEAGESWSSSYDQAATTVMGVTADVVNGSYKLASLLLITGDNHKRADEYSRLSHSGVPAQYLPKLYTNETVGPFTVPPSGGASSNTPTGWSLIEHAVGYVWPGGHQDKLRTTANAWSKAASALDEAGGQIPGATAELIVNESPEIGKAYVVSRSMGEHLTSLASAYRGMQDACNNYASYLDKAHSDAEGELKSLVEWTAGIEIAGGIAAFFTFGGAEVPTQAVEAGRIAATAARIAGIIRDLISAVKVVSEAVSNVITKVADVSKGLKGLLGARLSKATAELVSRLPGGTKTAEELAEAELKAEADTSALGIEADAGGSIAPEDLADQQLSNYRRFAKKLPAGAEDPVIVQRADGSVEFAADVPGRVPGSYATYTKIVDENGVTTSYYKTTVAPDGSIVHVKIKFP
jgi:hypothetical protein